MAILQDLSLSGNTIGVIGTMALAKSPYMSELLRLNLGVNEIGNAGAQALAESIYMAKLQYLGLAFSYEEDEAGIEALVESPHMVALQYLSFAYSHIGDALAKMLATSPLIATLRYLDLYENRIEDAGACALAWSPYTTKLQSLRLGGNKIGNDGAIALVTSPYLTTLKSLDLSNNKLINYNLYIDGQNTDDYQYICRQVQQYFQEDKAKNYELRLFLVGRPKAGKTTLRNCIFDDTCHVSDDKLNRTLGVDISQPWSILFESNKNLPEHIFAYFWDFGGQEIQYMCHQYFFNRQVFYILLIHPDTNASQITYWLDMVASLAPEASLLPVLNAIGSSDTDRFAWESGSMRRIYQGKLRIFDPITVDFKDGKSRKKLKARLVDELQESKFITINRDFKEGGTQLIAWCRHKKKNYLTVESFHDFCQGHLKWSEKSSPTEYINDFLHYLDFIGTVIHFTQLSLVVVDIRWLVKGLYFLFPPQEKLQSNHAVDHFYQHILDKQGYFFKQKLFDAWDDLNINEISKNRLFSILEQKNLDVIYPINSEFGNYFAPAHLKPHNNINDLVNDYKSKPVWVRGIEFSFIPPGLFGRLIVRFYQEIQKDEKGLPLQWENTLLLSPNGHQQGSALLFVVGYKLWLMAEKGDEEHYLSRQWNFLHKALTRVEELLSEYRSLKSKHFCPRQIFTCSYCIHGVAKVEEIPTVPIPYYSIDGKFRYHGTAEEYCPKCKKLVNLREYFEPPSKKHTEEMAHQRERLKETLPVANENITVNIGNNAIYSGNITKDSFNATQQSDAADGLKNLMRILLEQIDTLSTWLTRI